MDVKKVLRNIGVRTKKKLGQNFLEDEGILDAIVDHARMDSKDTVLEIGAGLGVLTERLAATAGKVITLEVDPTLHQYLKKRFRRHKNVRILLQDILTFDFGTLPEERIKVIANLPYYISTPILIRLCDSIHRFSLILIMLQKELAERVTAAPGTKKYGSLTVRIQYSTEAEMVRHIPKTVFYPQPKVDSALVRLNILADPRIDVPKPEAFFSFVRAAFGQRRKTLRNSLLGSRKFSVAQLDGAFRATGIDPTRRPETLSIEEFAALARNLL